MFLQMELLSQFPGMATALCIAKCHSVFLLGSWVAALLHFCQILCCFVPVQLIVPASEHNFASFLTRLHSIIQTLSVTCQNVIWLLGGDLVLLLVWGLFVVCLFFSSNPLMSLWLISAQCHLHIWQGWSLFHPPMAESLLNPTQPYFVFWQRHLSECSFQP